MADLLALSARIIDSGLTDQPVNRVTNELSEIADGIAMVESFSHCVALSTEDGLVCFDASGAQSDQAVRDSLRGWSSARVSHLVYTHGHADHIGGSMFFADQALADGDVRLACHLADFAGWAAPGDPEIHAGRAAVYLARRKAEPSLMAKGIFAGDARESQVVVDAAADETTAGCG